MGEEEEERARRRTSEEGVGRVELGLGRRGEERRKGKKGGRLVMSGSVGVWK